MKEWRSGQCAGPTRRSWPTEVMDEQSDRYFRQSMPTTIVSERKDRIYLHLTTRNVELKMYEYWVQMIACSTIIKWVTRNMN